MKRYIMRNSVFQTIKKDIELRKKIAESQGVQLNSVRANARDGSEELTKYNTLQIIKKHTGLKDSEIFEYK